jgi:hypothetical protein
MSLIRLLIIVILGYLFVRLLKRIFLPKTHDKGVQGESKPNRKNQYKNIEDADYEEID